MPDIKKVVLAYPYTDADGATHKADSSIELPRGEANRLLNAGLARGLEPRAKKSTAAAPATTDTPKGN